MFDNYFFLRRLTEELRKELRGFTFFKSISQSKNELVTGFFNKSLEKFLVFSFQKLPPIIYLKNEFAFAKKNYVEFFEILTDKELDEILIDEFERNIRFRFSDYQIIFLFRGNHSNVVLTNSDNLILESFKKSNELKGKNFIEVFPLSELDFTHFEDELKFNSLFENPTPEAKKYLKIIGNTLTEEIKFRVKKENLSYFQAFAQILEEFQNSPIHIYEDGTISFCRLHHLNSKYETSENLFSDLAKIYFSIQKNQDIQQLKEKILRKLKSDYEHQFKKLQELKNPENFIDRTNEFRLYGNLILINADKLKKGQNVFKTEFEDKVYRIKLDPTKTPYQNAEVYFEKAREEESRLASLKRLIEKTDKELEKIKGLLEEVENSTDRKFLMKYFEEQNMQSQQKEITSHFRHFLIDGKYDVFVGKDSKSNDLLTTQFAKPDDLWFHARDVSGSHLIIRRSNKKESIPKNVIRKAASIAAYYSKAKHSKLVPVAYTEKKYVIKRKGMPPGTVQLQRENVIMVEPKIPEELIED